MDITLTAPRTQANRSIGPRTLVVGALIGFALMYVYIQAVLIKQIQMPMPILSAISLLIAALVAGRPVGGWRWAPLLGTAWSLIMLFGSFHTVVYHLAHPEEILTFASQLVMLALITIGLVSGIGATVQNYRLPVAERRLPRWTWSGFATLVGLLVGAVAVAAIPQAGSGVHVAPATLAQLPTVPLDLFNGGEIRVRAGQLTALRLLNPDAAGHSFDVDELNVHAPMPGHSESLTLFTADAPGTYIFYCAPHYNKATGKGMYGTLIVEP